jgi:hypothetical protein
MPRPGRIYDIFLSSPGDVEKERRIVERVVADLNRELTNDGLSLNLMAWETASFSGIGAGAQEVVDRALYLQYDLYIGIMWHRFGTPTQKVGSGTEQEFNRAIDRHRQGDPTLDFAFFLRESRLPKDIDPVQFGRVKAFKETIRANGILAWPYASLPQFEHEVERHIREYARRQIRPAGESGSSAARLAAGADPSAAITGQLRALVTTLGRATHELKNDLQPFFARDGMHPREAGLARSNALRRLDTFQQEVGDISRRLTAAIRELAADCVLAAGGAEAVQAPIRAIGAEAEELHQILQDLVFDRRRGGALPVGLADIFDRHEKLVRLAQACLAEARQQLALVAGIRRKEGVLF